MVNFFYGNRERYFRLGTEFMTVFSFFSASSLISSFARFWFSFVILRMDGVTALVNDRIETVLFVGRVFHSSHGTVRVVNSVRTL